MRLMKLADFPAIEALSASEKLKLVDELWASIGNEVEESEVTDEEKRILNERWERYLHDPSSALSLEQFRKKIETLRR
jgi:putative addiction module component (TIGR02574 family)